MLEDAAAGRLQGRYQSSKLSDLKGLPIPRYDLLDLRRYRIPNLPAQTTRGCPYACSYCEVTQVYGAKFRYRPPEEVVEEVKTPDAAGQAQVRLLRRRHLQRPPQARLRRDGGADAAEGRTGPASARRTSATTARCST